MVTPLNSMSCRPDLCEPIKLVGDRPVLSNRRQLRGLALRWQRSFQPAGGHRKIRPKTFCSHRTFLPPSTGLIAVVAIGPIIEAEIEHVSERSELAVPPEA
jgi:hypothetical protein